MDEDFKRRDGSGRWKVTVPRRWFGMFRMLGYHQWRYIMKMNRGRKRKGRRGLGCYATPKTISFAQHHGDTQQLPENEDKPLQVGQSSAEETRSVLNFHPSNTQATTRVSLTAAEISVEKNEEIWNLDFPAHQLHCKDEADVQSSNFKGSSTRISEGCKEEEKNTDGAREVMEIFEINRELFAKVVQDPYVAIRKKLDDHQTFRRKAKFSKSRSFPVEELSGFKYLKASTLKHKQNEVWSFPKEHKEVTEPTSDPAKAPIRNDAEVTGPSAIHGWNQMILNHFKGFKRRITRTLKDNRKDRDSSVKTPDTVCLSRDMIEDHQGGSSLMNDRQSGESKLQGIRKTSSLHESADKYSRLFEEISSKDVELPRLRSLKLANDVEPISNKTSVKTFRRRLSLPENLPFLFSEASFGTIHSSMPLSNDREISAIVEVGLTSDLKSVQLDSNSKRPSEVTVSTSFIDVVSEDISTDENHKNVEVNLAKVLETSLHERTEIATSDEQRDLLSCPETLPPENETACIDLDNLDSIHSILSTRSADNIFGILRLDEKDDTAFIFIYNVLMISRVFDNELKSWYSEDQPLNPKLFHEVNSSAKSVAASHDHRLQLLFDLVNGTLLEIFQQSPSYFPKPFPFYQRVRSIPKGAHMVKEVWTRVKRLWYLRPELYQSLDDVMSQDIAKGDGWLNCQWDGECVALELEDLMFDELMDEVLNSLVV